MKRNKRSFSYLCTPPNSFRDVAQPGSALAWGARGRKFESCRPDEQGARSESCGFCFPGSEESLLSKADGETKRFRRSRNGASWITEQSEGYDRDGPWRSRPIEGQEGCKIAGALRRQSWSSRQIDFLFESKPVNIQCLQAFSFSGQSINIRKKQTSGELRGE